MVTNLVPSPPVLTEKFPGENFNLEDEELRTSVSVGFML